ncbi:VacJ protein [Candidatus Terasakiella magnetica]|nr:VacJ protein [Candidatus Terasakiella magnetica]
MLCALGQYVWGIRRKISLPLVAVTVAAHLAAPTAAMAADDPLEPFNRTMFDFNRALVLKVVAPTTDYLGPRTPNAVKTSLQNAYNNLTEVEFIINGALRRDLKGIAVPTGRFAINSTLGVAGLFDVATRMGLERQETDFIESLCQTGLPPGPYLVLPLVGSANMNSTGLIAGGVVIEAYALSFISPTLVAIDLITDLGVAAAGLRYTKTAAEADGLDPYQALREDHNAYLARGCDTTAAPPDQNATLPPRFHRSATPSTSLLSRTIIDRVSP